MEEDEELTSNALKSFQINITVFQAKHLQVANFTVAAVVTVGNHKQFIRAKTKRNDQPYFNRSLKFSFVQPLEEFLKNKIEFIIRRKSYISFRRKILGVAKMEAATIWYQPNHRYKQKWLTLAKPNDLNAAVTGYLKCSIAIVTESILEQPSTVSTSDTEIDEAELRLLKRPRGLFAMNIYRGDGFKNNYRNMYVKVIFAGVTQQTKVVKDKANPAWNRVIYFIANLPPMYQHMDIEVWDKKAQCLGTTRLSFSDLPYDDNKNILPTFGPAFLYIYKKSKERRYAPKFMGRILVSLSTKELARPASKPGTTGHATSPYNESKLPPYAQFTTFIAIFQILCLNKLFKEHPMELTLKQGASFSVPESVNVDRKDQEISINLDLNKASTGRTIPLVNGYSYLDFRQKILCLQATGLMPAMQEREGKLNYIRNHISKLENDLSDCRARYLRGSTKSKNSCCKKLLDQLEKIINDIFDIKLEKYATAMERSQWRLFHEHLRKIKDDLKEALPETILSIEETNEVISEATEIINRYTDNSFPSFPDIELSIACKDNPAKYYRALKAADHLILENKSFHGPDLGKKQMILFRDITGNAVAAMEAIVWFGKIDEVYNSIKCLPIDTSGEDPQNLPGEIKPKVTMTFQLRVYIYQARINSGSDASGLSDPFVRVLLPGQTRETQAKWQTLHPVWDETLLFSNVELMGDKSFIRLQSSRIMFEVLDYDGPNKTELIGRGIVRPKVTFAGENFSPPRLKWQAIYNCGEKTGQVLMAVEMIDLKECCTGEETDSQTAVFNIPRDIRPHYNVYKLELIFWGLRDYHQDRISFPTKAMVRLECHDVKNETKWIKTNQNVNFPYEIVSEDVLLPVEEEYSPPMCVTLYDSRGSNSVNYRGSCLIDCVERFVLKEPKLNTFLNRVRKERERNFLRDYAAMIAGLVYKLTFRAKSIKEEGDVEINLEEEEEAQDWWTKYYLSKHKKGSSSARVLQIYKNELEKQPEFENFEDFLKVCSLASGKSDIRKSRRKDTQVALLKLAIRLHPKQEDDPKPNNTFETYAQNRPVQITVRVYIIAGKNLSPKNPNGHCNPYLCVSLGKEKRSTRKSYISRDDSPIFGSFFEFKCELPDDYKLKISVKDFDSVLKDELIGGTVVDIENRFYTIHRASCGLANTYEKSGYCQWRDVSEPMEILKDICRMKKVPPPQFLTHYAAIGSFRIARKGEESNEELALRILKLSEDISEFGFKIVPEHIETRPLFHPAKGNINQGKLEMWVDILPGHDALPEPVNINPRIPEPMELRVIVWSTSQISASEGFFSSVPNLKVRAWITSKEEAQMTDIHYSALAGNGLFNWRFVFNFMYSPTLRKVIVKKKSQFSNERWLEKIPCVLNLQVFDDRVVYQEHLGTLSLTLWDLPQGGTNARSCNLSKFDKPKQKINLFKAKRTRGWWPFRISDPHKRDEYKLAGKIDLELQVFTKAEAEQTPAGLGRQPPQPLPEPKRLKLSGFWFLSPLWSICNSVCGSRRKEIYGFTIMVAIGLFILVGLYAVPGYIVKKAMNA